VAIRHSDTVPTDDTSPEDTGNTGSLGATGMVKASRGPRDAKRKQSDQMRNATAEQSDKSGARIDPRIQREIGRHLRAHYDDLVNEPVPDKFMQLLQQLEKSVEKKS